MEVTTTGGCGKYQLPIMDGSVSEPAPEWNDICLLMEYFAANNRVNETPSN